MALLIYGCGCTIQATGSELCECRLCEEHAQFAIVQKGWRVMREALEEAHRQLPPGPQAA